MEYLSLSLSVCGVDVSQVFSTWLGEYRETEKRERVLGVRDKYVWIQFCILYLPIDFLRPVYGDDV